MSTNRIHRWILTGKHVFETSVDGKATGSTVATEPTEDAALEEGASVLSEHIEQRSPDNPVSTNTSSQGESRNELLIGCDNDLLRPTTDQINYTFSRGERLWRTYIAHANSVPPRYIPEGCLDPYILMQNMPPLPQDLPRQRIITGQALWHVPHPELPKSCQQKTETSPDDDAWNPEDVYNFKKGFALSIDKPTACRIASGPCHNDERPNSMAILTLCWGYMFCVRFLEMQKRPIRYSSTRLTPVYSNGFKPQLGDNILYLGSASTDLVRWLCALLAPGLGWTFIIVTDIPVNFLPDERPPSSKKAADLLIEFCALNDDGSPAANGESSYDTLQQPTAGFLAALALPFYNELDLQPQLPMPRVSASLRAQSRPLDYIRDYVADMPYFMTLSISPASMGSIIWSIFWEPGVECNLVSAWFGSILEVIRPIIKAGNVEMLAKIFTLRRKRVGLLWRAIFDLGNVKILDMIVSYLESHEERWGGSFAGPDIDVAAWTGSPQSFFDESFVGSYQDITSQVPRSDLLRHRFNFRLGDLNYIRSGWQPFGRVTKKQIEPDLWHALESGSPREYKHRVWWLKDKDDHMIAEVQHGLRYDKAEDLKYVDDELLFENNQVVEPSRHSCSLKLAPSFEATWSTMHYGATEASGDKSLEATLMEGIRKHPWFADSRGI
ncbi:hypothetical protein DL95DRAFT_525191 [Leptodontidium sp. 2 PMI_412]|nr:hypothetical protein DL95DRAFT_525191 [Leptodontidium sp. 2 PMI_412]